MKKVIVIISIVALVLLLFLGIYLWNSNTQEEKLSLSISTPYGMESSVIERDNELKTAKIYTTTDYPAQSELFVQTAVTSCYLFQEMYFNGREIKFNHEYSEEERNYLTKMNDFIKGYTLIQATIEAKTGNAKEGFTCLILGNDDIMNSISLVYRDGSRTNLTLNQAKQQYLGSSNTDESGSSETSSEIEDKYFIITGIENYRYVEYNLGRNIFSISPYESWASFYNGGMGKYNAGVTVHVFNSSSIAENAFNNTDGEIVIIKSIQVRVVDGASSMERLWRFNNLIIQVSYNKEDGDNLFNAYFEKYS